MKYRTSVYIIAPPDQITEVRQAAAWLYEHGYSPIYRISSEDPPGLTIEQTVELALPWLAVSERVVCLPGKSSAVAETLKRWAETFGLPVFESVSVLLTELGRGDTESWGTWRGH